jgi:GNAT superfamily N-acetyltransferase
MVSIRIGTRAGLAGVTALDEGQDTAAWLGETGLGWHERALPDPDQEHLIAEDGGRLAGYAVLAGLRDAGQGVELRRMAVDPAQRGTGVGRGLLRAAVARARDQHGAGRVWLDVKARNNRAWALYESEGFAPTGDPAVAFTEPGGTATELVVMALPLR